MSGFLILIVLAVVSALGVVGWFATPKGNQQTYAIASEQLLAEVLIRTQACPNYDTIDPFLLFPDVGNHIYGSAASFDWYALTFHLPTSLTLFFTAPKRSDLRFEEDISSI